jgi:hypothetical protein
MTQSMYALRGVVIAIRHMMKQHASAVEQFRQRGYDEETARKLAHRWVRSDLTGGLSEEWNKEPIPPPPPPPKYPTKGFILDPSKSRPTTGDKFFVDWKEPEPEPEPEILPKRDERPLGRENAPWLHDYNSRFYRFILLVIIVVALANIMFR